MKWSRNVVCWLSGARRVEGVEICDKLYSPFFFKTANSGFRPVGAFPGRGVAASLHPSLSDSCLVLGDAIVLIIIHVVCGS
jgi:hypothetical protein